MILSLRIAVPILAPPSIFTSKCVVTIMAAYWPILALSVSKKLVYHFRFLSALLCGLLLQHKLHASICFVGCKHSDPSVLAAGKWRSLDVDVSNNEEPPRRIKLLRSFLCDAVSTHKIRKSKVHAKHHSIMVISN